MKPPTTHAELVNLLAHHSTQGFQKKLAVAYHRATVANDPSQLEQYGQAEQEAAKICAEKKYPLSPEAREALEAESGDNNSLDDVAQASIDRTNNRLRKYYPRSIPSTPSKRLRQIEPTSPEQQQAAPSHDPGAVQQSVRLINAAKRLREDSFLVINAKGIAARVFLLSTSQQPESKIIGFQTTKTPPPLSWVAAVRLPEVSMKDSPSHYFATLEDAVDNLMDSGFTLLYGLEETSLSVPATRHETLGAVRIMRRCDGTRRFTFGHRDMRTAALYWRAADEIIVSGIGNVAKFRDLESALAFLQFRGFHELVKIGLERRLKEHGIHPDEPNEMLPLLPKTPPDAKVDDELEEKIANLQHFGFDVGGLQMMDTLLHEITFGRPVYSGKTMAIGDPKTSQQKKTRPEKPSK